MYSELCISRPDDDLAFWQDGEHLFFIFSIPYSSFS